MQVIVITRSRTGFYNTAHYYDIARDKGKIIYRYWSSACPGCALKPQCTTSKERRVSRWEHEDALDAMEDRVDRVPDCMGFLGSTVEHPFGTIKSLRVRHFQSISETYRYQDHPTIPGS